MIQYKNIHKLFASILLCSGVFFGACSNDDIVATPVNEEKYETTDLPVAYTINANGKATNSSIELRNEVETELFLKLNKETVMPVEAEFYYNEAILNKYNEVKGTKYIAFPEELLTFSEEGKVMVESGKDISAALKLNLKTGKDLNAEETYVIPVSAKTTSKEVKVSKATDYMIFVRDLTTMPDAAKESGIKIISCMEVNDTNPLNNLNFTLKESGKPLVDIVILFSGNINYNPETGKVFNHNNPNVQHLLDNREKYLKPLQDRGMKVVLGILGNHDVAGVANLADETAKAFAQELKAVCDAYHLDGIFWDDEYSKYPDGTPGFERNGPSRLVYETKQAMPDKLNMVYAYGSTGYLSPVDGVQPGDYIDWAVDDYGGYASGSYLGIKNEQWSVYSQEYNLGRNLITSASRLMRIVNDGYKGHMIFAMDPNRSNVNSQIRSMQAIAEAFYNDELVVDNKFHKKDW